MCAPKLLHHSELGLVRFCQDCRHYQIAFGTIVFTLEVKDFYHFGNSINKISALETECKIKDIWINLPAEDVGLLLNTLELIKLKELIGLSLHTQRLNTILQKVGLSSPK
ncbi:MAG: hypothetical protein ACJAR8_001596 [Bacteroidia bacterium]|jgi:hypothetical protein